MTIETQAQITTTKNLISLYGTVITLQRPSEEWTTSPAGGQIRGGVPSPLQPVARWFQRAQSNDLQSATDEGDQSYVWGIVVGLPCDDIKKGDTFVAPDGLKYEVRYVHATTANYETRAEVFSYES